MIIRSTGLPGLEQAMLEQLVDFRVTVTDKDGHEYQGVVLRVAPAPTDEPRTGLYIVDRIAAVWVLVDDVWEVSVT